MTKKDKTALIGGLKKLSQDIADIAALLEGADTDAAPAAEQTAAADPGPEPAADPERTCTYEEARAALSEKARKGYRAEVKALLTAHGLKQLSDAADPAVFAALMAEAEEIGNA